MTSLPLPQPVPAPYPGAHIVGMGRHPLEYLTFLARSYGDIVPFQMGNERVILISHPDLIQEVLVTHARSFTKGRGLERIRTVLGEGLLTSEGSFHLRQRRLVQPAFHRQRVLGYGTTMAQIAEQTVPTWPAGLRIDLHRALSSLTLQIVGDTLFGTDVRDLTNTIAHALDELLELFPLIMVPGSHLLEGIPFGPGNRLRQARADLDAAVAAIIDQRRSMADVDHGDLLSMLMLARDEEGDGTGMTNQQLRDEALTLLLAGHETTANAVTWACYLLSQHPEVFELLRAEALALGSAALTGADAARLPYARMVLTEAMRLYPPAWLLGRRAAEDVIVGGYLIKAGTLVFMSQWVVQRSPRFFPDPERFDPQRWAGDAQERRPRYAYFPFGGGPRICVGEQFAWMEGVLLLAVIARNWQITRADQHPIEPQPLVTLRPRGGVAVFLTRPG